MLPSSGRVRIFGLGVGACEASFIADEGVEVILALDSAEGIISLYRETL